MDLNLKNRIALITGGASGIGAKTAEFFVQEGCKVFLADIRQEQMGKGIDLLRKMGGEVDGGHCDVSDEKMVSRMVDQAIERFGTVDFLINSAGIGVGLKSLEAAASSEWQRTLEVNLIGTIHSCKAIMPILRQKKAGRIVNISSEAGVSGERGLEIYAASKGGVIALTKSLARELGRYKVTVNAVAPAFVHSPLTASLITPEIEEKWLKMYQIKRLGEPQDIASMIVFLCSERCSWITGQTISINGGFSMR